MTPEDILRIRYNLNENDMKRVELDMICTDYMEAIERGDLETARHIRESYPEAAVAINQILDGLIEEKT